MNVIVSNERQNEIANLNIEVIKSIHGVFETDELIQTFSNFFFGRMILDLTAIKDYKDVRNLQKFAMSLDVEKIIVLLPDTPECLAPSFLSKIISMGIYNFTTNIDGVNYLLSNPNTYRDVAHLHQIDDDSTSAAPTVATGGNVVQTGTYVLGIQNVTEHSGATMLIFMLKKMIQKMGKSVLALEVGKRDFMYFNDKEMLSVEANSVASELLKNKDKNIILVDLNKDGDPNICNEVLYLVEPSTIKLNKIMLKDAKTFEKLAGRKIILSQSVLSNSDVKQFEFEARIKIFFVMPPLDERYDNSKVLEELLSKLGIINYK